MDFMLNETSAGTGPLPGTDVGFETSIGQRPKIAELVALTLRLIDQRGPIVVYLTAVSHREGTTTVARALAAAAARSPWCKVALVDASWEPPATGSGKSPGLLDVTDESGELPLRRASYEGVDVMECVLRGQTASVPRVETVRLLFSRLRKQFTLVIVDSAPIFPTTHIAALSGAADCVVIVVEAERTRAADLERTRLTLEQLGAQILGVVLNKRRSWIPGILNRLI